MDWEYFLGPRTQAGTARLLGYAYFVLKKPFSVVGSASSILLCFFCRKRKSPSQSRGYAGNGGLSIGFDPDSLSSSAKNQGFRFMKCLYDEEEKYNRPVPTIFLLLCCETVKVLIA